MATYTIRNKRYDGGPYSAFKPLHYNIARDSHLQRYTMSARNKGDICETEGFTTLHAVKGDVEGDIHLQRGRSLTTPIDQKSS